jgi:hypothetical protein
MNRVTAFGLNMTFAFEILCVTRFSIMTIGKDFNKISQGLVFQIVENEKKKNQRYDSYKSTPLET